MQNVQISFAGGPASPGLNGWGNIRAGQQAAAGPGAAAPDGLPPFTLEPLAPPAENIAAEVMPDSAVTEPPETAQDLLPDAPSDAEPGMQGTGNLPEPLAPLSLPILAQASLAGHAELTPANGAYANADDAVDTALERPVFPAIETSRSATAASMREAEYAFRIGFGGEGRTAPQPQDSVTSAPKALPVAPGMALPPGAGAASPAVVPGPLQSADAAATPGAQIARPEAAGHITQASSAGGEVSRHSITSATGDVKDGSLSQSQSEPPAARSPTGDAPVRATVFSAPDPAPGSPGSSRVSPPAAPSDTKLNAYSPEPDDGLSKANPGIGTAQIPGMAQAESAQGHRQVPTVIAPPALQNRSLNAGSGDGKSPNANKDISNDQPIITTSPAPERAAPASAYGPAISVDRFTSDAARSENMLMPQAALNMPSEMSNGAPGFLSDSSAGVPALHNTSHSAGAREVALPQPRADLPAHLPSQITQSIVNTGGTTTEIRLSPEELGSLRIEVATDGDRVSLTLLAERPDTLDLLRRHADRLMAEFRAAGFNEAAMEFGTLNPGDGQQQETASQSAVPEDHIPSRDMPLADLAPDQRQNALPRSALYLRL
ncbi:hypothetical protein HOY34_20245 [Xinfangfangia sp. D13-10-4-6]|uniref:flagellar hook-length control protein FliK n=1 Tax=Pseudogemmobacter hezensis TaxID=2737662 RepID=UPI00155743FC|nr:flagellar hook-length control protein FliK [Pseudogemmobacter hezensis]NPD17518.1 hypothetical protein [Pseudogemmobacter hezensis]